MPAAAPPAPAATAAPGMARRALLRCALGPAGLLAAGGVTLVGAACGLPGAAPRGRARGAPGSR